MAVYEAMARMAQDFSMRCLLVDGQGNFGSVDGDPPAAMRYTEARLAAPAQQMLTDIHKDTVDFEANFDDTLTEPTVLPSAIPNLLVNGATGIAVGMSTSIPPHNLGEVVDALKYLLENWERMDDIGLEDLMRFIQGPDFPTGGVIIQGGGEDSLASAYGSGRGRVTVQARAHLEEMERGRNRIIVTELPYMTNKSALIERIAELARESKLEGLADLRDESDRQGMRIVIDLVKTADPEAVLRDLYRHTPMQSTFSIIMLALVEGEPRLLGLKQALRVYLDHRLEIIRRRSQYDLEKARQRAHILEGYRVALKNLDEVIDLIRKASDADTARTRLMKRFRLSEIQAQAILELQLRRLAALERKKIEDEYKETIAFIKELEGLLRSAKKMRQVAAEELQAMKDAYGDRRRTQIVRVKEGGEKRSLLTIEDLAEEKMAWLVVTPDGLVSRTLEDKMPRQSGNDAPAWLLHVNTRDTLYLACLRGETAAVPVHAIPETDSPNEGISYARVSALTDENELAALFTLPPKGERGEDWYVLSVTRQGMVKKTGVSELPGPAANTFTLVKVNEEDTLGWLALTDGKNEVLLVTAQGMAIRFSEDEVRPMGLVAAGVMGIKLQEEDEVVGMDLLPQHGEVFLIASDGSAKRVQVSQFPRQGRYGQGVVAWKTSPKAQVVGMTIGRGTTRITLHLSKLAPKMVRLDDAPLQTRTGRGKRIQELKAGELVLHLAPAWEVERPLAGGVDRTVRKTQRAEPSPVGEESKPVSAKLSSKRSTGRKKAAKPVAKAKPTTRARPAAKEPPNKAKTIVDTQSASRAKRTSKGGTRKPRTAKASATQMTLGLDRTPVKVAVKAGARRRAPAGTQQKDKVVPATEAKKSPQPAGTLAGTGKPKTRQTRTTTKETPATKTQKVPTPRGKKPSAPAKSAARRVTPSKPVVKKSPASKSPGKGNVRKAKK
jgi:DNA gyrase subunit A